MGAISDHNKVIVKRTGDWVLEVVSATGTTQSQTLISGLRVTDSPSFSTAGPVSQEISQSWADPAS